MVFVHKKEIGLKNQKYLHWMYILESGVLTVVYKRLTDKDKAKLREMEMLEVDIGDSALGHDAQSPKKHKLFNAFDTLSKDEKDEAKMGLKEY